MADFNDKINEFTNTTDTTAEYDPEDIQKNKGMSVLAYIGLLFLIPLFAAKESKFAKFHTNQGFVLFICEAGCSIVANILDGIPYVGWIFSIAGGLVSLACLVFAIIGIVNVSKGKAKELPIIGNIKILK